MHHEEESVEERERREVLLAVQFAHRKAKGALTEIREALQSLDKLVFLMKQ